MRLLRTTLATISALLAFGAVSAHGDGLYNITVCGGGQNRAWSPSASSGMVAAPAPKKCGKGMTARNEVRGSGLKVADGSAARFTFKAPAGGVVNLVTLSGSFETGGARWRVGISDGSKLLFGCESRQDKCSKNVESKFISVPGRSAVSLEAVCARGPCNVDHQNARGQIRWARVTVNDKVPPSVINAGGSAWTTNWIGGKRAVTFGAQDGSGILRVATAIDGTLLAQQSRTCGDYTYKCRDWNGAVLDVDLTKIPDGAHDLAIGATDRGGNNGTVTQRINVDNTPPTPPVGLASNVARGWTSSARVHLGWSNPAQQFAPIAGATVRACPAGQSGGCVTTDFQAADLSQVDYDLPGEGAWDVSVWLRDAAGNASPGQASAPVRIGLDRDPPRELGFRTLDPSNPSILHVHAVDSLSGIAGGEIQMRRRGTSSWRSLDTKVDSDGLRAQIPDGRLPNGVYRLRARVVDVAGNERTTARRVDGKTATVRLPVRVAARMRVGQAKKVRARGAGRHKRVKIVYVRRPILRHGRRVRVGGRLIAPGGNALARVRVEVSARLDEPGTAFRPVATLRTNRHGRFAYSLPPGRNRVVRFNYRGAPRIRPQRREIHVRVRAATSISANHRKVVNGETVTFTGHIQTGPQPATGKLVELQYFDRGEWRTFRSVHAGADRANWSFEYRFTGTSGTRTYKFRARLPRESDYGYAAGASHPVKVTVRGL